LAGPLAGWVLVGATPLVFSFLVARREQTGKPMAGWAFLGLTWVAVLVSYGKSLMHPKLTCAHGTVELIFTLSAAALTWFVTREIHRNEMQAGSPVPARDGRVTRDVSVLPGRATRCGPGTTRALMQRVHFPLYRLSGARVSRTTRTSPGGMARWMLAGSSNSPPSGVQRQAVRTRPGPVWRIAAIWGVPSMRGGSL